MKIKLILTDIDGVLTDGTVILNNAGGESKRICYRDLDAVGIGRAAGLEFGILTGEDTPMARIVAKRFSIEWAWFGIKDKVRAIDALVLKTGVPISEMAYIGDSDRDAALLEKASLGIVPKDGTPLAKRAAGFVTDAAGGGGVLFEVVSRLIEGAW